MRGGLLKQEANGRTPMLVKLSLALTATELPKGRIRPLGNCVLAEYLKPGENTTLLVSSPWGEQRML